jgi:ATP-binding cassette subfamily B protein
MSPEPMAQAVFKQQLASALGQSISAQDFSACLRHLQILEPNPGKKFWHSSDNESGIYIVITGRVRLLDRNDELLVTLGVGMSFGASTLFPDESFQVYAARASIDIRLYYLPDRWLKSLMDRDPGIRDHLYQQAIQFDLLLICRQAPALRNVPLDEAMALLALLTVHHLDMGRFPEFLLQEPMFWLIRHGELRHISGKTLGTGSLYVVSQSTEAQGWQITQPTELYHFHAADLQIARQQSPYVDRLIAGNTPKREKEEQSATNNKYPSLPSLSSRLPISKHPSPAIAPVSQTKSKISRAYFPSPAMRVGHWWQRVIHRYPFFEQQSVSDCGAACLVMIARYWGKKFSVNRLRDIANVDRNGSSLRGLAAAAESIGFSTRPVKASLDKLADQPLPAIVHWEGRHYIVVYEITRQSVIVGDPAIGQRSLTLSEFKAGWTGYALLLQPTALLKEAEEASQPFWQFLELTKPHWLVLTEVFIASLLIQIFGLVTPLLTQLLLDRVVVQRSSLTLTAVGMGLLIFGLFRVAMTGLRQYLLDHTANRIDLALIVGFIQHTFRLPLNFFESRYVGDIIARVQENRKIQRFLTGEALSICLDMLTVFVYVSLMFWYSWKMALLSLVIVPPFFLLVLIATPFLQRVSREIFNALANENSYLIQALTGIRTVKAMAVERSVRWRWEELLNKFIRINFSGQLISNQLQVFSSTIEAVSTTCLLWFGAWLVIQNELTIGQLVAFNMLLGNIITPFRRLTVLWYELQEVLIAMERINDVIDAEPEEDLHHQPRQSLSQLQGHVQFEQVTFRYHPESDVNILENLSFEIQPKQMVAIVGRSGSGKTTLAKLILGLYLPSSGKVLIDGQDITNLSMRSLRQQIGVVDQDTFLFGGTIRENISIGHPEATLDEIKIVAQQAGADSFIQQLPMGYETQIGEGGGLLSGGQRQRLAIARALLGTPRLLIFDEATSHLDSESERIIQANLDTIVQNRTTIVIAHRLSTVRRANLILVLDRGVLVESGTHEELMDKRGHYFYLNQQQLAGTQ